MHYLLHTNYLLKKELASNLYFVIKALKLTVYVLTLGKKAVIHILRLCEITIIAIIIGSCIIWPTFYNWLHL